MKIALLIRSLEAGGAERQLVALACGLVDAGHDVRVITFYPGGALLRGLEIAGIPVSNLGKRSRWEFVSFFIRLAAELRAQSPVALYCFLTTSNLVGLAAGRLAGVPGITWGIRASDMDLSRYDWMSRLENWMCRKLAPFTDRIVLNSHAGARYHLGLGFPADKITVIENGIDTDKFRFDSLGREKLRSEWGVRPSDLLIGLPARLDPMKDHITALRAFANLRHQFPAAKLVCVGSGPLAHSLPESSRALGLDGAVIWAGLRLDMAHAYSALDVSSSSSSWGEGFSNTTAEAMACERACVVTDVGDSAAIVGDTGWVVPARSPEALSAAWREALHMTVEERQIRGAKARKRVEEKFSVTQMVTRTVQVLKSSGDFSI